MASPFLYFVDERLTLAELCAARLDGDVAELGVAYTPADTVETVWLRAGSLREMVPANLAVTHLSAAWVHGTLPLPPTRHTVQRAGGRRSPRLADRTLIYRDVEVDAIHVASIAGVLVTTPAKTLSDLLRVQDAAYHAAAESLARAHPNVARSARLMLESSTLPYKREALQLLSQWCPSGHEDVTR